MVLLLAHPDATCDKIVAHLYNKGGEIYSNQTISKHLKELDITQKIASALRRIRLRQRRFSVPPLAFVGYHV